MFEDRPVPVDDLKTMLETAVWVPNHKMTQPWRFIFVHGESRKTLAEIFQKEKGSKGNDSAERKANSEKNYQQIMNVPLFLMVVMDENPVPKLREEDYAATSCVIQNFSLLAWEQGIGMIWKTNQMINKQEFRDAFSIERGEKAVGKIGRAHV